MGYSMTADEVAFWQDQAALLDPAAYELVAANSTSRTVSAGERWYLVNGWHLDATGAGTTWFHRPSDVNRALVLSEGTVIATGAPAGNTAFMYLCKPSLVTGSDARYTADPRGLYFDRINALAGLTQYQLGATNTGSSTVTSTFPTDFTEGFVIHASVHDVAWLILRDGADTIGVNLHNEISDTDRIRWAERLAMPFLRTDFPKIMSRGASETEGRATLTYVKLPGGW